MSVVAEIKVTATPEDPRALMGRLQDSHYVGRHLEDMLNDAARVGQVSMKIYAPHGASGELERHLEITQAHHGEEGEFVASTGIAPMDDHDQRRGAYPDIGTGIFGSRHAPIRPLAGRFMVFEVGGRKIVTTSVKGQRPQHFVRDALYDVNEYLPARLDLMAHELIDERERA